jgi:hypothetical protein
MPTVYSPPVSTYVPLASYEVTGTDNEVVFSSIPATYRDLIVVFNGGSTVGVKNLFHAFNGETALTNYSIVQMSGTGSATDSSAISGSGQARSTTFYGYLENNLNGNVVIQYLDYSATDKHKTFLARASHAGNGVTAIAGRWASTAAISSLAFTTNTSDNFVVGSTFSLYGIEA